MKKYFIMAIAAIATFALVSCEPKEPTPDPTTDAKVVLRTKTLELTVGAQEKLRASLDPAKEGLSIVFTSDNEAIATVDKAGVVTGIAAGTANIIAGAEGYKADTCVVNVVDAADAFTWGGMGLFDLGTEPLGDEYTWTSPSSGKDYLLKNFVGTYYLWSSDIIFTNGVGFSGAGYMVDVICPVAIIQEGSPNGTPGYYVGCDLVFDSSLSPDSMGINPGGSLTDPAEWGAYLFDSTYTGNGSFTGCRIDYYDFEDSDNTLPFVGFIKDGWIGEYSNGTFWQMNITWFDLEQGLYGLKMEQNTEGKWQFVEPYEFTDFITRYYENMPAEEAVAQPKKVLIIGNPEQKRMLQSKHSCTSLRMKR